jgi:hypothetical protein
MQFRHAQAAANPGPCWAVYRSDINRKPEQPSE